MHVLQLKRLLFALKESSVDIGIRFRVSGEMWQRNHCRVVKVTEKGVVLKDERLAKQYAIQNLNDIMQFDLDEAFQQYKPHFHYTVSSEEVH